MSGDEKGTDAAAPATFVPPIVEVRKGEPSAVGWWWWRDAKSGWQGPYLSKRGLKQSIDTTGQAEPDDVAAPSGEGDDIAAPEPQAYVPFNAQGERDDTQPPDHYRASYHGHVVPAGAEMIDWLVAMRGKDFAVNHMIAEIQCKANRLGLGARAGMIAEDCFKIRQACRVIARLEGEQ